MSLPIYKERRQTCLGFSIYSMFKFFMLMMLGGMNINVTINVEGFKPLKNLYYPVVQSSTFSSSLRKPVRIEFFNKTFVAFKKSSNATLEMYCDVCPHMGASLSKGIIDNEGRLQCPYHGISFSNGTIENGPCFIKDRKEIQLTKKWLNSVPYIEYGDMVWSKQKLRFQEGQKMEDIIYPHLPPEHYDSQYRYVEGVTDIDQYQQIVNENLLDMLHISFVHSFGNRFTPIPIDLKYEAISEIAGRSSFIYSPNALTISTKVGGVKSVLVENEFYLPSVTVTRVKAGEIIKTVWTSSLPLKGKKTRLFWRVYRNFWRDPIFSVGDVLGDWLVAYLMKRTLDEDKWILGHVYENERFGPLRLKYDITINKYRQAILNYQKKELKKID